MDTTEELYGYFYARMPNLSAVELFFWITVDETMKQLGVDDIGAVIGILCGQPNLSTRQKPKGSTKGTSVASVYARKLLPNVMLPFDMRLPTIIGTNSKTMKIIMTRNLRTFVGRTIPILGWVILLSDVTLIIYNTVVHYNKIVRDSDKLW